MSHGTAGTSANDRLSYKAPQVSSASMLASRVRTQLPSRVLRKMVSV